MKQLLFIFTLLLGFTALSQGLTLDKNVPREIKLVNGKIYQDDVQIPSYQVKKLLASNLHSLKVYKQAKSKEGLGGTLLGIGITMTVVDLAIGLFSDAKYPTALTYVGLGAVVVSVPILSGRRKKVEEAVKSYNEGLKNTSTIDTNFGLNAMLNQNGVGIQIQF